MNIYQTKQSWMQIITLLIGFLCAQASCNLAKKERAVTYSDFPNIVILYADDMGYGDLAIQNQGSKIPTPNLDQLAREGMRFTDGHSSSGICTPSRYALLTGRHHWRKFHGIVTSFGPSVFDEDRLTLPEMLKEKGYKTACIGKWHLGFDWTSLLKPGFDLPEQGKNVAASNFDWSKKISDGPTAHGFDYYFGDDTPNFPPYGWIENDSMQVAPTKSYKANPKALEGRTEMRPGPGVEDWRLDSVMPVLTRKAVAWITEQKNTGMPFFLYFPWTSPHTPIVPTETFHGKSGAGPYGDFMVQSDWTAGQVLRALKNNGFEENTIVIFTSDNGSEYYMIERLLNYEHNSSGSYRGIKRDIYEGGHHVPFMVKWPGVIQSGSVSNALISQVDIMATIAAALSYNLPEEQCEDGLNMLSVFTGKKMSVRKNLIMNTWSEKYGIRNGDWTLILDTKMEFNKPWMQIPDNTEFLREHGFYNEEKPMALFNLVQDNAQRNNLVDQYPEKVKQLQELLYEIRDKGYPEKHKMAQK